MSDDDEYERIELLALPWVQLNSIRFARSSLASRLPLSLWDQILSCLVWMPHLKRVALVSRAFYLRELYFLLLLYSRQALITSQSLFEYQSESICRTSTPQTRKMTWMTSLCHFVRRVQGASIIFPLYWYLTCKMTCDLT